MNPKAPPRKKKTMTKRPVTKPTGSSKSGLKNAGIAAAIATRATRGLICKSLFNLELNG